MGKILEAGAAGRGAGRDRRTEATAIKAGGRARQKSGRRSNEVTEKETKAFYKREMIVAGERRAMANAEAEMKKFLKDEEFYNRKSKYDVGGGEPVKPSEKL